MKILNVDSEIMGGEPVFNGTRVPIKILFDYLMTGETIENFLDSFPSVERRQVLGLLQLTQRMINESALLFDERFQPTE